MARIDHGHFKRRTLLRVAAGGATAGLLAAPAAARGPPRPPSIDCLRVPDDDENATAKCDDCSTGTITVGGDDGNVDAVYQVSDPDDDLESVVLVVAEEDTYRPVASARALVSGGCAAGTLEASSDALIEGTTYEWVFYVYDEKKNFDYAYGHVTV